MIGLDARTGKPLSDAAHLAQSIADILSTPIGTRVMRRDYGSALFDLIDRPLNAATRMLIHAATAMALSKWEPRLKLTAVRLSGATPAELAAGRITLEITGRRTDVPAPLAATSLTLPLLIGATS